MRIADFRTTVVSIPFTEPETWAFGRRLGVSNVIIEIETDTGLVGLGEGMTFPSVRITNEVLNTMRPLVLGCDPFDHEVILHGLTHVHGWHHFRHTGNCALGGIDMALWDLVGQACGQPLYKLFGGAFRKEIPYYFYVPDKDLKLMAADAKRGWAEGFRTFYVKLGRGFDRDLDIARTLREALGPAAKLRVDANESWSNGTAIELMKRMSKYDIEFFEQPLYFYDHEGAAHLRSTLGLPVAANQSAWDEADILEIVKKRAADVVLTDQHQLGSLARFRRAAWLLATAGIPVVKHTFGEYGISTAAGMHAIASCPNFTMANQTHFGVLTDDVVEGGLAKFTNGCLTLPEGPGLGVKLDRERLAKYAQHFHEHGEYSGFGSGEDLARRRG
ncbi:MAG: mandelate racemase/muconate lactonizing enzyme family protein [Terriglobia bacterium]|jgi:L-alanine-DL-glutamate epimerase-like enolase superfamily enzyme